MEELRTRRWTRAEYDRAIEAGLFHEDEPIELIDGQLVVREPQNTPHAKAVELAIDALCAAFGSGWRIRPGLPLALDDVSEPEPDIAVVRGSPRDPDDTHPSHPTLVVEIAESSFRFDRGTKATMYARAGVPEYWIVNLVDRVVEIHREPTGEEGGFSYRAVRIARPGDVLLPLAAPDARIAVADLLP